MTTRLTTRDESNVDETIVRGTINSNTHDCPLGTASAALYAPRVCLRLPLLLLSSFTARLLHLLPRARTSRRYSSTALEPPPRHAYTSYRVVAAVCICIHVCTCTCAPGGTPVPSLLTPARTLVHGALSTKAIGPLDEPWPRERARGEEKTHNERQARREGKERVGSGRNTMAGSGVGTGAETGRKRSVYVLK